MLASLLALAGCGGSDHRGNETRVLDPQGVLGERAVSNIREIEIPTGHALVVSVVTYDPDEPVGPQADRFADEALAQCDDLDRCAARGIVVLVDAAGGYPQLRVGDDLELDAAWGGATYGPAYTNRQLEATGPPERQAAVLVPWAVAAVDDSEGSPPFVAELLDGLGYGWLMTDVLTVSYPETGFYQRFLVWPVLRLQLLERDLIGTWFISLILLVGVVVLVRAGARGLTRRASVWKRRAPSTIATVLLGLLGALVAFPLTASMVLQSAFRVEDQADVHRVLDEGGAVDLWNSGWAPARNLLIAFLVLVVALVHRFVTYLDRSGPTYLLPRREQDALAAMGAIPVWSTGFSLDEELSNHLPRLLLRLVGPPLLLAYASYALLPAALVFVLLVSWVLGIGILLFPAIDTWRWSSVLVDVANGREPAPDKVQMIAPNSRHLVTVLAVAIVSLLGWSISTDSSSQALDMAELPTTGAATTTTLPPLPTTTVTTVPTDGTLPPYDPAAGQFSVWPAVDKPTLTPGSEGYAVLYLQDVLKYKGGLPDLEVTGVYGGETQEAVLQLQKFFGLARTGTVDDSVWAVVDQLAVRP